MNIKFNEREYNGVYEATVEATSINGKLISMKYQQNIRIRTDEMSTYLSKGFTYTSAENYINNKKLEDRKEGRSYLYKKINERLELEKLNNE